MHKKQYCSNCGKFGHISRECNEPIISIGMIILKIEDDFIKDTLLNLNGKIFIDEINNFNYRRLNNLKKINLYKDKIKFLLVKKKHSLNFIEFIRGLYEVNDEKKLIKMFNLMSIDEIIKIKEKDFTKLWNNLWKKTAKKKIYQKEYQESLSKFNILKTNGCLDKLLKIKSIYNSPEWEFPKGRKNINENYLSCAIREINEETTLCKHQYDILNLTDCFHDIFKGTNDVYYKHIYYLSLLNYDLNLKLENNKEIEEISFFDIENVHNYIRNYNKNKLELLNKIFLFIINLCEDYKNQNNICLQI